MTDLASAQRAIDEILEQGEGPRGAWQSAHFGQFVEILDEYTQAKEADLGLMAARPVQTANVRPCDNGADVALITDPVTARVMDLFNVAYEVLLQIFERFFAHTDESDTQLQTLATASVGLMAQVISPLGDLITTLPAGPEYPGQTAGPSFELFYESDYLLPHRDAAWTLLAERLDVAAGFAREIVDGDPDGPTGPAPANVTAVVEQAGATLARLSGSLAAFLPPSAPHAPAASGAASAGATAPADADLPALQARADDFHLTPVRDPSGNSTGDLARTLDGVWTLTTQLLQPGPGSRELRWLAPRLIDSVLRPLADALKARTETEASKNRSAPPETPDSVAPADQVWQLAQDLTRLRVRSHQDGEAKAAEPGLAEATAALQDLACALAPAAGRAVALRDLQAELPASIQVARNGPYLATNVASVRDYLGQEVPVPPQVALCRCGASERKPFCDGSHASNGFTGDKDPKRVPDHRDTYDGEQVTVFDNRGVCQHSGFCTDRLNTVFRTNAEPFVAPSGGRMDEIVRAVRDCPSGALGLAFDGHEQRALADWHGRRYQAVEITKDGPYRITGGLSLTGPDGAAVPQGAGASREHYALCRCGHSQNKPFCSGMHWYVGFSDPELTPGRVPSLFEWAGGLPGLTQLTRRLYEKLIPADPLLAPAFADLPPGYPEREAARVGAAFGGPAGGSVGGPADGGDWVPAVTGDFPADQQARWVALAGQAAAEVGLPADAPFRAALTAFLTWYAGAALTSQDSASQDSASQDGGLPSWGWTRGRAPGHHRPARSRGHGPACHPARAGRAGELRRPRQADVPGQGPAVHAVRVRSVVLRRRARARRRRAGPGGQRDHALRRGLAQRTGAGLPALDRDRHSGVTGVCPFTVDRPIMRQRWERLSFLHWGFEPAAVQRLLPGGLTAETWDGAAWVGLVPFFMQVASPDGRRVPWVSNFCETNVRTYVRDESGRSGIWFFSLDAARLGAVLAARCGPYRLPYFWSSMRLGQARGRDGLPDPAPVAPGRPGDQPGQ